MRKTPEERSPKGIDKAIRDAMQSGQFDNLPGAGKPLLPDNPYERPEDWAANRMLRNHDVAPAWIEERKAVEAAREKLLAELMQAGEWYANSDEEWAHRAWLEAVEKFREDANKLNRKIRDANLKAPPIVAQLRMLRVAKCIRAAEGRKEYG